MAHRNLRRSKPSVIQTGTFDRAVPAEMPDGYTCNILRSLALGLSGYHEGFEAM